jgi:hypothetical protein
MNKFFVFSGGVLAAVGWLVYAPALNLTFFGDDYLFIEAAGRASSLWQYLVLYFDPRLQTAWYRPIQGMRYGLIYALFGAQPLAYHLVNVLIHIVNSLLFYAIVWRVSRNQRIALLAGLLYVSLPVYSVAVFWPGVADFGMTLFFLTAILCWVWFRQSGKRAGFWLAIIGFVLALCTKELAVVLPPVLFLIDWGVMRVPFDLRTISKNYLPFAIVLAIYAPIEYTIQTRGIFVNTYGYGIGAQVTSNLLRYLGALTFPWLLPEPWNYVWLALALVSLAVIVMRKKDIALVSLVGISALTLLPVTPFPWVDLRYLYLPITITCILFANAFNWAWTRYGHFKWFAPATSALVAGMLVYNAFGVQFAASDFNELARQARVPFRDIAQHHAAFPIDTYLYFIDPLPQVAELSGMFFLRYGAHVTVGGNTGGTRRADLTRHQNSIVIWFDAERRTRELPVDATARQSNQPIDWHENIRLMGYELPSTRARRNEAFAIILYWQAMGGKIDQDYSVRLELRDPANGTVVTRLEKEPGKLPTSAWKPDELVVDARVLSIPSDAPLGNDYVLAIGAPDATVPLITIAPLSIVE